MSLFQLTLFFPQSSFPICHEITRSILIGQPTAFVLLFLSLYVAIQLHIAVVNELSNGRLFISYKAKDIPPGRCVICRPNLVMWNAVGFLDPFIAHPPSLYYSIIQKFLCFLFFSRLTSVILIQLTIFRIGEWESRRLFFLQLCWLIPSIQHSQRSCVQFPHSPILSTAHSPASALNPRQEWICFHRKPNTHMYSRAD